MREPRRHSLTSWQNSFRTCGPVRRTLAGCAIVLFCGSALQAKPPQWQYLVVNSPAGNRTLENLLNTNGAQGWELVQVDRGVVIFKRLKK